MVQETNVQYAQVRKGKRLAVVTVSVVMFAVSVLTAVPARADASRCWFFPYGAIGNRWQYEGGQAAYGCALEARERDIYEGGRWIGRAMRFERGEIAWSPNHDRGFLTVGIRQDRKDGSLVWFSFGDTYPYHYDKFNVAWYKNGDFVVQREKSQNRQWGQDLVRVHGPGRYTAKVEGCDTRWLRRDRCDQGWTVPVSVDVR